MARSTGILAAVALVTALLPAPGANARPGDADASFGAGGEVILSLPDTTFAITTLAELPDGSVLSAGHFGQSEGGYGMVARFRRDGSLDPDWGEDGIARIPQLGAVTAVTARPGGGAVVLGFLPDRALPSVAKVVRLEPDGTVDPNFVTEPVELDRVSVRATFGQADGGFVIAGWAYFQDRGGVHGLVMRFAPSGDLDRSFGEGGSRRFELPGHFGGFEVGAEQPGGGIVVGGEFAREGTFNMNVPPDYRWTLVRFRPDGTLDSSFGEDGVARDYFRGPGGGFTELVAQPDGKLLLGGTVPLHDGTNSAGFGVARANPDGARDTTFSDDGLALHPSPVTAAGPVWAQGALLAPQANGGVASVGQHLSAGPDGLAAVGVALGRLTPAGELDSGFGVGGWSTALGPTWMRPRAFLRTADGTLVVASDAPDCDSRASSLMRFHSEDAEAATSADAGPAMRTCASTVRPEPDGDIPVPVQCPAVEDACRGSEVLELPGDRRRIGVRKFALRGGATGIVRVRASRTVRRLIQRRGTVLARATFRARDREGHLRVTRRPIRIKRPRRG